MIRLLGAALALALSVSLALAQSSGVAPVASGGGSGITQLQGDVQTLANQSGTASATSNASGTPFRAGNWYAPSNVTPAASAGAVGVTGKITCHQGTFGKVATVNALGSTLTTVSALGNIVWAVYMDSAGRPAALVASGSANGSTSTAGDISSALTVASGYTSTVAGGTSAANNVQLGPGTSAGKELWWCTQVDNTTAVFNGVSNSAGAGGQFIGSTTMSQVTAPSTLVAGLSTPNGTFGSWPASLSGVTWTSVLSRGVPMVAYMISSVP